LTAAVVCVEPVEEPRGAVLRAPAGAAGDVTPGGLVRGRRTVPDDNPVDAGSVGACPDREAVQNPAALDGQDLPPGCERRHLTVLVCDLVNSTGLFESMDPEDTQAILQAVLERCATVITRCGGYIAQYTGDGILAFFGYPYAHEDAVERSVHTGLALVETLGEAKSEQNLNLQIRVGIATGLVVNDRLARGAQGQLAAGRPLILATRLQTLAPPGSVIIADGTRCLLAACRTGIFERALECRYTAGRH
jgi:class 3 adenylate cyclase